MFQLKRKAWMIRKMISSRTFAVTALSVAMASILFFVSASTNAVYIRDEGQPTIKYTCSNDMQKVLDGHELVLLSNDVVQTLGFQGKYAEVNIIRSFPVEITADGKTIRMSATTETTEELLKKAGITYDSNDILSLPLEKTLMEGDNIVLQRVDYVTRTVEQAIPYETITKENSLITVGRTRVIQAGRSGRKILTYIDRTIDGVVQQEELIGEDILSLPVTQEILVGAAKPVSELNFGISLDSSGKPVRYKRVIENAIATGYSAGDGAWGASGMNLSAGYVAVNPREIPYGSKLYITSADGRFIYGCAIAADTGTSLMNNEIDVDLFYDTYLESCLNGKKAVNIYVLE